METYRRAFALAAERYQVPIVAGSTYERCGDGIYNVCTVFDVDVRDSESIIDAWRGESNGSWYIVIDPIELDRFSKTYFGIPPLPPDFSGPRDRISILPPPQR